MNDQPPMNEQLILELYTRNISASVEFYQRFGFRLLTTQPHFVELGWDQAQIYLDHVLAQVVDGLLRYARHDVLLNVAEQALMM